MDNSNRLQRRSAWTWRVWVGIVVGLAVVAGSSSSSRTPPVDRAASTEERPGSIVSAVGIGTSTADHVR